jgi:hypothetical protein
MNAMDRWTRLDPKNLPDPKGGPFICTNNIGSRNAHGRMSHVFLTNMFHLTDGAEGPITAFAEPGWTKVWNVTHYIEIGTPESKP